MLTERTSKTPGSRTLVPYVAEISSIAPWMQAEMLGQNDIWTSGYGGDASMGGLSYGNEYNQRYNTQGYHDYANECGTDNLYYLSPSVGPNIGMPSSSGALSYGMVGVSGLDPEAQIPNWCYGYSQSFGYPEDRGMNSGWSYTNEVLADGHHQYYDYPNNYSFCGDANLLTSCQHYSINPQAGDVAMSTHTPQVYSWSSSLTSSGAGHPNNRTPTQAGEGCLVLGGVSTNQKQTPFAPTGAQVFHHGLPPPAPPENPRSYSSWRKCEVEINIPRVPNPYALRGHTEWGPEVNSGLWAVCPFRCGYRLPVQLGGICHHLTEYHPRVMPKDRTTNSRRMMPCPLCHKPGQAKLYPNHFLTHLKKIAQ